MRKLLVTILSFTLISSIYSQKTLRELVSGEQGTSRHFTTLSETEQIPFNPQQARAALNLDLLSDLVLQKTQTDQLGFVHYRYYQSYKGIPVENSMYLAHIKAGRLTAMNGEIVTEFDDIADARSSAGISASQAINAAINFVNAKLFAWQDAGMEQSLKEQTADKKATYYPTATLSWFNDGDQIIPRELRLAWKVDVYARQPLSRAYYFIDAQTGKILGKKDEICFTDATGTANTGYSGTQTIHSDLSGSSYRLRDITKGSGIITLHGESGKRGTDYTSPSANWALTGTDQAAMDAHYGVSQTYSFYKTNFNRNSYDNAGTALRSYVNDPAYIDNAYWDGSSMNFCKRSNTTTYPSGVTGIDVTGHELTHGVTQAESGLNYSKEPGAMNESMSDIFGKSVQFWSNPAAINWTISNVMNWNIRNMANPNAFGDPDTYKGTNWVTSSADNYGVHTNSGVGNYMFYLLVTGGSGTNDIGNTFSVTGIGLSKADQILYRSNTLYLTPTSQYADWRVACINSATDLYGAGSNEVLQVQNAWYAVGVGAAGGACNIPSGLAASALTTTSANLSWSSTGAATYNLQWKLSSGSTWTTVSGIAANSYNLTGLAASTNYQFQVQSVCATTTSNYSAPVTFTTASGTVPYCTSKGNSTAYEYIKTVALGSINNTSNNNNGYGNYTGLSTNLSKGVANNIALTPGFTGTAYAEYWSVYIDYSQDGDFSDAGELVAVGSGTSAITRSFTVPATAKNGPTRMRIQMKYGSSTGTPCGTFAYGEVEDYSVNISAGTADDDATFTLSGAMKPGVIISPNPVAGSDAIVSYSLINDGKVTLRVMDLYGRSVKAIELGQQTTGAHTFTLNNTKKFAAGNYFIVVLQDNGLIGKASFIIGR